MHEDLVHTNQSHIKKSIWHQRISGLRSRIKWPGWSFIILGILTWIPDWKSRLDFWMDVAKQSEGIIGVGAHLIASPYSSPILIITGLIYLALVGEPKKGVQRHPRWPYIGWIAFGICSTTIFVTAVVGYVQISIKQQVGFQIDVLQKQLLGSPIFWHLPEYNKILLGHELDKIDKKDRFEINFKCLVSSSSSQTYLNDLGQVFLDHEWKVKGDCLFSNLKADLLGVYISVPKQIKAVNDLPPHVKMVSALFKAAGIAFNYAQDDIGKDEFFIVIGNSPNP